MHTKYTKQTIKNNGTDQYFHKKTADFQGKKCSEYRIPAYKALKYSASYCTLQNIPVYWGFFLSIRGIADSIASSELFHIDINDREPFIPTTASGL